MKTFTGMVISAYLAVGVPLQVQAESVLEAPHMATVPSEAPSLSPASGAVKVTASEPTIQVGETVHFYAVFDTTTPAATEVYGWLHSPVNENGKVQQERLIQFLYDKKQQGWVAQYTVTPYDVAGNWTLELWSFSDTLHKTENTVSFTLNNPKPLQDEKAPQLKAYTLFYNDKPFQNTSSIKQEGSLAVHVQAFDDASGVRTVTAKLLKQQDTQGQQTDTQGQQTDAQGQQTDAQGQQTDAQGQQTDAQGQQTDAQGQQTDSQNQQTNTQEQQIDAQRKAVDGEGAEGGEAKEIKPKGSTSSSDGAQLVMSLPYNVHTQEWTDAFDMTTVPEGKYELVLEIEDYAGNVVEERTGSKIFIVGKVKQPPQDTKKQVPPVSPVKQSPAKPTSAPTDTEPEKVSQTPPVLEQVAPQAAKASAAKTPIVKSETKKEEDDAPSLPPKKEKKGSTCPTKQAVIFVVLCSGSVVTYVCAAEQQRMERVICRVGDDA